ncbi:cysteine protease ATG4A isoform X1 [Hemiscyllium ocellatum]|uniref:cysteine protease ATG4A isoform X1 n=2 Tax=Hemiscyllium ocellatum TaxID=170820 RepID=UPI002966E29F|nr:cysteine protease ATG4A isoform X1 [Hemiscyllium ocellatum]
MTLTGLRMDAVLAKCENQIPGFSDLLEDFPDTEEPTWILGKQYHLKTERSELLSDVRSRLWFTYRKKFSPIGGTGPSSDAGWGCMLRCGQMILAQALICRHLGMDWRWEKGKWQPEQYHRILQSFLDRKDSCYSIHQMAQMGVGEGKSVGEWYGPNTVAQVLKKLALFDDWNALAVYISMDNTVVIEDIKKLCKHWSENCRLQTDTSLYRGDVSKNQTVSVHCKDWKPLLLIIPLRMGINHINPVYINALKECFKMPQSLGVLGGKPNNAYYFIGFLGDELIYLDPHTTQAAVDTEDDGSVDDYSYHCQRIPHRMKITHLDPSVALGFFCNTERDFESWCNSVQKEILKTRNFRMFELVEKHPPHWPPFVPATKPEVQTTGAEFVEPADKLFESEEEFEILNV